jgi:hypothetical protein
MISDKLNLYRSNWGPDARPLIKWTPVNISVVSFVVALLFTFAVGASDMYSGSTGADYLPYYKNISWSVSMIVIFPAVLGLTLYYYQKAPVVLEYLFKTLVTEQDTKTFDQFCTRIDGMVNDRLLPVAMLLAAIVLNAVYLVPYLSDPSHVDNWMMHKQEWSIIFTDFTFHNHFTFFGLFGALTQIFLAYWILVFIAKNILFISGLYEFFRGELFKVKLNPLHPDGVNGLRALMELATLQATLILFLGLYASLKFIDKIYQQHGEAIEVGNMIILFSYVIFAPLLFFLILGSAHQKMREAKEEFLGVLSEAIAVLITSTSTVAQLSNENFNDNVSKLKFLQDQYALYSQRIPVWPFNWRSMQGFFGAVIAPVIPPITAAISYGLNFVK